MAAFGFFMFFPGVQSLLFATVFIVEPVPVTVNPDAYIFSCIVGISAIIFSAVALVKYSFSKNRKYIKGNTINTQDILVYPDLQIIFKFQAQKAVIIQRYTNENNVVLLNKLMNITIIEINKYILDGIHIFFNMEIILFNGSNRIISYLYIYVMYLK